VTWAERGAKVDAFQQSRGFKIGATILILVLAIGGFIAYWLAATPERGAQAPTAAVAEAEPDDASLSPEARAAREADQKFQERLRLTLGHVLDAREDPTSVGVAIAVAAGLCIAVVWLGLGLTYLGLLIAAALIVLPLARYPATAEWARLIGGMAVLVGAFTTLLRGARLLLSGSHPVLAVANNVLAEAVRLKLSLVFIVLLIFMLASLPGLLNEGSPLRYRVQSFLQYGTGGAFWFIAALTLLFSVSTVATEQRDKIIWQTVTKPVSAAQYLAGKWIGVMVLNAILLGVAGAGVFLFTEYLRGKPAIGERSAYVATRDSVSEDRLILETQVLAARVARRFEPPEINPAEFEQAVDSFIEQERKTNPFFGNESATRDKIRADLLKSFDALYRSVDPGQGKSYRFSGLLEAKDRNLPLTFRYRIDSGNNRPDVTYRLTFRFSNTSPDVFEAALAQTHSRPILPTVINDDGTVDLDVVNGDYMRGMPNPLAITFPPEGLELSYSAGSYRMNFLRVMIVLWVKLAFLSIIAITASTCLSFSVASLVAIGTFLCAESANFISQSLVVFDGMDQQGSYVWWRWLAYTIARIVSNTFSIYADLRPTTRLVEGVLLPWESVAVGTVALTIASLVLYAIGVMIFKRRELAIYSGN
jgi:ABC-type transport system involved in multi-copper enzyme maturation permease subunit